MRKTLFITGTLLVAVSLLLGACESTPSPTTSTPQVTNSTVTSISSTNYPADITGKVTIVDRFMYDNNRFLSGDNIKFWIIDVYIKNNGYMNPISGYIENPSRPLDSDWKLVVGDKEYKSLTNSILKVYKLKADDSSILNGQSGRVLFIEEVNYYVDNNRTDLNAPSAIRNEDFKNIKILYKGQSPYSYGDLILSDKALVYDWTTKTVVKEPATQMAKTNEIDADNWKFELLSSRWSGITLEIELNITNLGDRRNFGLVNLLNPGPELAVVDSTNKLVQPFVSGSISKNDIVINFPSYTHEFYPGESLECNLKFEMSQYSKQVGLWYSSSGSWTLLLPIISSSSNDVIRTATAMQFGYYKLFDLGSSE